jgi:DNA polymerase III delta subunit
VATRLTPHACLDRINAGDVAPVYFIHGPDTELKSSIISALGDTLEEDLRAFNFDRQQAAESKGDLRRQLWTLLDLARTMPMLVPRRIVVLTGAERVLGALRDADGGSDELEAFEAYLKAPEPHTTIVFVASGDVDGRLKVFQVLKEHATTVTCDPLADLDDPRRRRGPNVDHAIAWVKAMAVREGVRIEPGAVRLLATLAGSDVDRLRAEFERARLFASGDGIITEAAVQEVASSPTSRDPWAITNALERRQAGEALRELALKLDGGEFPLMILGQLGWFVRTKMPPPLVAAALDAVFRTDLAMKTSRGEPRVLLERLIVELCG